MASVEKFIGSDKITAYVLKDMFHGLAVASVSCSAQCEMNARAAHTQSALQ